MSVQNLQIICVLVLLSWGILLHNFTDTDYISQDLRIKMQDSQVVVGTSLYSLKGIKPELNAWFYYQGWALSNKNANRKVKTITGNGRNSLNIFHWNMGARQWPRKLLEIRHFLTENNPDIFIITEANLLTDTQVVDRKIEGYQKFTTKTMTTKGRSRVVVLAREEMNLKLREDLMDNESETIWLQLERKGRNKLLIGAYYREQSLIGLGHDNKSSDRGPQTTRWRQYLKQWKMAGKIGDTFVMGDLNLDYSRWSNPSYLNEIMVDETKMEIETEGFHQLVTGNTRTGSHLVQQSRNGTISHKHCKGSIGPQFHWSQHQAKRTNRK